MDVLILKKTRINTVPYFDEYYFRVIDEQTFFGRIKKRYSCGIF